MEVKGSPKPKYKPKTKGKRKDTKNPIKALRRRSEEPVDKRKLHERSLSDLVSPRALDGIEKSRNDVERPAESVPKALKLKRDTKEKSEEEELVMSGTEEESSEETDFTESTESEEYVNEEKEEKREEKETEGNPEKGKDKDKDEQKEHNDEGVGEKKPKPGDTKTEDGSSRYLKLPKLTNLRRPTKVHTNPILAQQKHALNTSILDTMLVLGDKDSLKETLFIASTVGTAASVPKKPVKKGGDRIIHLNIGGTVFETFASTLIKYPNTLLGAMFNPRTEDLLSSHTENEFFFDRDPRAFEVILNYYRTGKLVVPSWIPLDLLSEELRFFMLDLPTNNIEHHRLSVELLKMDYRNRILDAAEYKKITRHKLLSDHHNVLVKILDRFSKQIELSATQGHNSCEVTFRSPLHYTDSTPRSIFDVIAKAEIRELVVELLKEKKFTIMSQHEEYSKTKATDIIGLDDQVILYNDPKFFSFLVKW